MACLNPMLMNVVDITGMPWKIVKFHESKGWKISPEKHRMYHIASKESRDLPLENIEDWRRLDLMELPCCNCVQCRLDYSRSWATRCYLESQQYQNNFFITLTYDESKVPLGKTGNMTLKPDDLTQFMKNLRQYFKRNFNFTGIRFFGCGEYGIKTNRPHYHLILFNCPLNDLTPVFVDENGQTSRHVGAHGDIYFYSKIIHDCWNKGFIMVADANYNTEAYVARYIMKKQKGKQGDEVYNKALSICTPFLRMSNRPGIGEKFLNENELSLLENPSLIVPRSNKEPMISGIPRYYKNKLYKRHPEKYDGMLEKAVDKTIKSRSLIKQSINNNREASENHISRVMETFSRDKI